MDNIIPDALISFSMILGLIQLINLHLTSFSKLVIAKEFFEAALCVPFSGFSVAFFSFTQGFWFKIDYIH
jgi:hypothetical protein